MSCVPMSFDDELRAAWPDFMAVLLEQRMQWSDVASELGVSSGALRALLAVDPSRPKPMSELARDLNCDRSYVTGIVDDLERASYVERRADAADRRVRTVALTTGGRRALRVVQERLMSPPAQLATLTPAQQRTLAGLLRRVVSS